MATAKIILYKSKVLQGGTSPIRIQVIHDRKVRLRSIGKSCLPKDWDEVSRRLLKSFPDYKNVNTKLNKLEARLAETLDWFEYQGIPFTIEKFFTKLGKSSTSKNVLECFDEIILRLKNESKIGNMKVYKDTRSSLKRFIGLKTISFPDVDYSFLRRYETFLRSTGSLDAGIHLRLRTLRAVYNEAIKLGYVPFELYPFGSKGGNRGYSLSHLKLGYSPRALTKDELVLLKGFDSKLHSQFALSYSVFMFSYYAQGMNFTDIVKLKWSDIHDGRLKITRQKTKRLIDVAITSHIQNILNCFSNDSSDYIFPLLLSDNHITPQTIYNRTKKCLKQFNSDLKEIQKLLGINTLITSYTARHTYAQSLRRGGNSDEIISHNMGHANVKVTQAYLSSLGNSLYDDANSVL